MPANLLGVNVRLPEAEKTIMKPLTSNDTETNMVMGTFMEQRV